MFKRFMTLGARMLVLTANVGVRAADRRRAQGFPGLQGRRRPASNRYTQFTIFDDVSASVKDGVVTLTGKVTMPYKRDDIEKRVAKVDGVREVRDQDHGAAGLAVRRRAALPDRPVDLRQLEFLELRHHGRTRRSTSSSSTGA